MSGADPDQTRSEDRIGLRGVGTPFEGTDARPADHEARTFDARSDDQQGGFNEQQDELRAHAAAQSETGESADGLDDTRASRTEGSINDNGNL